MVSVKTFCSNKAGRQEFFPGIGPKGCQGKLAGEELTLVQNSANLGAAKTALRTKRATPPSVTSASVLAPYLDNKAAQNALGNPDTKRVTASSLDMGVQKIPDVDLFINGDAVRLGRRVDGKPYDVSDAREELDRGLSRGIATEADSTKKNELDRIRDYLSASTIRGVRVYALVCNARRQSISSPDILNGIGVSGWQSASHVGVLGEAVGSGICFGTGIEREVARLQNKWGMTLFVEGNVGKTAVRKDNYGRTNDGFWEIGLIAGARLMLDALHSNLGVTRFGITAGGGIHHRGDSPFKGVDIAPGFKATDQFGGLVPRTILGITADHAFWSRYFAALDIGYQWFIQEPQQASISGANGETRMVRIEGNNVNEGAAVQVRIGGTF